MYIVILFKSTECSSCALEYDRTKVILYLHKDIPALDYIDIASELTRFVYRKALDTLVHSISDKLSSPLETLKRRGIPVDRLLKNPKQQRKLTFYLPYRVAPKIIHTVIIFNLHPMVCKNG